MHYRGFGTTGANGYEFREELRLLFTDGWAYTREDLAPADLDVEASRRLEPQYWERWRQAGGEFVFQSHDDFGQARRRMGEQAGTPARHLVPKPAPHWRLHCSRLQWQHRTRRHLFKVHLHAVERRPMGISRLFTQFFGAMAAQSPVGFSASASSSTSGAGTSSTAGRRQPRRVHPFKLGDERWCEEPRHIPA